MKKVLFAAMLLVGTLFATQPTTAAADLNGKYKEYEPCYNPRVFYFCLPGTGSCSTIRCYFWP